MQEGRLGSAACACDLDTGRELWGGPLARVTAASRVRDASLGAWAQRGTAPAADAGSDVDDAAEEGVAVEDAAQDLVGLEVTVVGDVSEVLDGSGFRVDRNGVDVGGTSEATTDEGDLGLDEDEDPYDC